MTDTLRYPHETPPSPGQVLEVADGIKWLQMPLPFSLNHINLYLLEDGDGWAIVDTGISDDQVRAYWDEIFDRELGGKPVTRVIVTHMHPDHVGNAGWLCDKWNAQLLMTRTEFYHARGLMAEPSNRFPETALQFYRRGGLDERIIDEIKQVGFGNYRNSTYALPTSYKRIVDGGVLMIGGRAWHVVSGSGHSPEHACLYCEELDILISGDQVLPRITSNVSVHPMEPEENPLRVWLESHKRFLRLPDTAFVLPAHNRPFFGLHERLQYLIDHHEDRMLAIEETCTTPKMASELLDVLFERELDSFQTMLALGECFSHLHCLMDRGRLEREIGEGGVYLFRSIDPTLVKRAHPDRHDEKDEAPLMV